MKRVTSSYVRDNWALVMDEAHREPIAVTSHGRARVIIVDAALAEKVIGAVPEGLSRVPDAPRHPWLDPNLPIFERMELLDARKKEIWASKPWDQHTDEEIRILYTDPFFLDEHDPR